MRNRPMLRQLRLVAAVFSLATLIVTAVALVAIRSEEGQVAELAGVSGPAITANSVILQTMTEAEASLRGFLASGDTALLAGYNAAGREIRAEQDRLGALLASQQFGAASRSAYERQRSAQDEAIARWWRHADAVRAVGTHATKADVAAGDHVAGQVSTANAALSRSLIAHQVALRAQAGRTLTASVVALVIATLVVMLGMFAAATWVTRSVAGPIMALRDTAWRQRMGDSGARADEDAGPAEVRSLAVAFNAMTSRNAELVAEQAEMLRLQQAVFAAGREIRVAASVRAAMEITCAQVGMALGARRAMALRIGEAPEITTRVQWHVPGIDDLPALTEGLERRLCQVASEMREAGERLIASDLLAGESDRQDWAGMVNRETGATALIMVPVSLGSRVVGALCVCTDTGPRQWKPSEAAAAQQVATFLARAIIQSEQEEQRAEYTARLESLDRHKTEFLGTVSHELRTPLTSIQGYLELLGDGEAGPLGDDQRHMLAIIERNAVRLRGLIEDILVLNRIETGGLLPGVDRVSLASLAVSTAEDLRPLAGKAGITLHVQADAGPAEVTGDRVQLQRALVNILSNAIKFTPRGGDVWLSCTTAPAAGEVVVTCRDTGMGIPKADQEHLFTRFYRASNAARRAIPGTGLGLAIVAAIVEVHQGKLSLDSAEGVGTVVTLRLPVASPPADSPADSSASSQASRGRHPRAPG